MSRYHNTDVWTFLKLMMIEHIKKMMQTPYLHIWLMLLSGNVPHRTNSSQLFWNGIAQKKKTNRVCVYVSGVGGGGCWGHGFSLYLLGLSQVKQNPTSGNLVKLCMLFSSEISRPKTKSSGNFTWIFLGLPWMFHVVFN